jgi:LuxR family maltose regulon positive regulatory protein
MRIEGRFREPIGRTDSDTATAAAAACLHERVLPAMGDGDILDFALVISVADAVSPPLAARLETEHCESASTWLEHLAGDGLMIAEAHGTYRWPPAVRRALYREAQRREPEQVLARHRVAAEWFCDHGQSEAALRHATHAGDWALVVRVIETFWESLLLIARPSLIAAFGAAPSEIIDASLLARLLRSLALSTADAALWQDLPSLPEDPARLHQLAREPDALARLRLANAIMIALRTRGHHAQASEHARRLAILAEAAGTAHSVAVSPRLPGLLLQVGITHLWAGEFTAAHRAMRRAYNVAASSPISYVARDAAGKLALLLVIQGDTDRAATWLDRHEAAPRTQGWLEHRVSTSGLLARAWSALDRLEISAAAVVLDQIEIDTLGGYEISALTGYVEALHRLLTNRVEEALHELSHVIATFRGVPEPSSLPLALLTSMEAELLLALGRANHARATLATMPEHPMLRIPRARMLLLNADPNAAIGIANDYAWLHAAPPRLGVEMLVIKAVAHYRNAQPATATATLGQAISTATVHQLRRPFAGFAHDELLEIAGGLPPDAVKWLRGTAPRDAMAPFPTSVDLVHLTRREQLILTHLADGHRAHEIATELFLSYNTVRTYLRQIYKKLAANSREQAVARARAYGLIAP